jgi:hypothetical protein
MSQYIETNYCIYNLPEVTSYRGYTKITLYLQGVINFTLLLDFEIIRLECK